jgi:hypothetical protein
MKLISKTFDGNNTIYYFQRSYGTETTLLSSHDTRQVFLPTAKDWMVGEMSLAAVTLSQPLTLNKSYQFTGPMSRHRLGVTEKYRNS